MPTFTRDVAAATAPVIATLSHQPWVDPSAGRQSSSSGIQTVSNPIASAPQGQLADIGPARGRAIRPCFLHREHETDFDGPHGILLRCWVAESSPRGRGLGVADPRRMPGYH